MMFVEMSAESPAQLHDAIRKTSDVRSSLNEFFI